MNTYICNECINMFSLIKHNKCIAEKINIILSTLKNCLMKNKIIRKKIMYKQQQKISQLEA